MFIHRHFARQCAAFLLGLLVTAASGMQAAGSNPAEEEAIRKLVAEVDAHGSRGVSLPDTVFWSGALKKPEIGIGGTKANERQGEGALSDRAPGSQKIHTQPIRIVIADNRDLAYEYSNFTMEFTTKAGKFVKFDGSILRVWQKKDGEWKQAAFFARPHDD